MKPHRSIATSLLAALSLSPAAGSAAPPAPQQAGPRRTVQTISPAPSQDASPAPQQADALSRTAGEMSAKGEEAQRQGKYDQCHAWFLAAWSIRPHKQIAGNLAACEVKLGLYRDAAEHLSFLAQAAPDGKAAELLPEHRRLLDEALSKIAVVHLDAGSDALVLVDGKLVGQAPLSTPVYLEPGDHTLEARSSGGTARQTTRFDAGTQKRISLHPQAPSKAPAPPPQEAPPAPREAPPPPPVAPAPPDTRVRDGVVIGGLALGGAAIAAGVVLVLVSNGKSGDADDALQAIVKNGGANACNDPSFKARCDALDDAYVAKGTTRNLAIAGFMTAGAALGGAALAYVLWPAGAPRADAEGGVRITPAITARSAGLTVGGAF